MTASVLTMDPESTAPARASTELFRALHSTADRLAALDAARRGIDEAGSGLVADVTGLLSEALRILAELERVVARPSDELGAEDEQTWAGVRPAQGAPLRVEDVCFVAGFELERALRTLAEARDAEAAASASETALRKLQRVLHAVLESAEQTGMPALDTAPLRQRLGAELSSALAVRQLYARFRRGLRRPESDSREAVLTALRYAASGLAMVSASPHYPALRVSDRALLRRQRERLLDWAHAGKPTEAGLQLLEDIFTCADLLRDINRRQELRAHDVRLIRELVGDAEPGGAEWLAKLEGLAGLDDALDELRAALSRSHDVTLVIDLIMRLSCLVG